MNAIDAKKNYVDRVTRDTQELLKYITDYSRREKFYTTSKTLHPQVVKNLEDKGYVVTKNDKQSITRIDWGWQVTEEKTEEAQKA